MNVARLKSCQKLIGVWLFFKIRKYALHVNGGPMRDSVTIAPGVHLRVIDSTLTLVVTADGGGTRLIDFPLKPMLDSIAEHRSGSGPVPQHLMTINVHQGNAALLARFTQMSGTGKPRIKLTSFVGDFYFKIP